MGLDMYLEAKKYVGYGDKSEPIKELMKSMYGLTGNIKSVTMQIGYWRKFNHLHGLMQRILNKQENDEIDLGKNNWVDEDSIKEVLQILKDIKADPSKVDDLMPATSGFFFGSADVDEYFNKDVDHAIEVFENALHMMNQGCDIYYTASW